MPKQRLWVALQGKHSLVDQGPLSRILSGYCASFHQILNPQVITGSQFGDRLLLLRMLGELPSTYFLCLVLQVDFLMSDLTKCRQCTRQHFKNFWRFLSIRWARVSVGQLYLLSLVSCLKTSLRVLKLSSVVYACAVSDPADKLIYSTTQFSKKDCYIVN